MILFKPEILKCFALDNKLLGEDYRVLFFIFSQMNEEGYIHITQEEIGKPLNISQPNIATSVKKLVTRGYLKKEVVNGKNAYQLNERFDLNNVPQERPSRVYIKKGGATV